MARSSKRLSVIICTYNRSNLVDKCITSVLGPDTRPEDIEIIIVDNNSTDQTASLVKRYMERYPQLIYVKETKQGLSHARNRGNDQAKGEYLTYLDDDATAPEGYIRNLIHIIDRFSPDIISGPVFPYYDTKKPRWFKDEYEIRQYTEESGFSDSCRVSGGNFTIKKKLLLDLGGFDVNYGMCGTKVELGEERALLETYRRITPPDHQKVYYSVEGYVNHYVSPYKMRRRYMLNRSFKSGRAIVRIKKKDPASAISRSFNLIPKHFQMLRDEIKENGVFKAEYTKVMINFALRSGNIVELLSHGWRPVLGPSIQTRYKKFRVFLKKKGLKRVLFWFETKTGINQ